MKFIGSSESLRRVLAEVGKWRARIRRPHPRETEREKSSSPVLFTDVPACGARICRRELRRNPTSLIDPSYSAMKRARSRALRSAISAALKQPTAAPFSWTRSADLAAGHPDCPAARSPGAQDRACGGRQACSRRRSLCAGRDAPRSR